MEDESKRVLHVVISQRVSSLVEATAGRFRVIFDAETWETVSTNVPIGGWIWRRMARIARGHMGP